MCLEGISSGVGGKSLRLWRGSAGRRRVARGRATGRLLAAAVVASAARAIVAEGQT
jgi:hypothetical protein